ncbi:GNAT family N-acetyltransferase [Pannonibacter phragmitetus]|uniref:GNAT family N-acetyltransferase n=1 Tax=Pannonibacter phragmitetus TaxID=121719 RepID=UPI003D2F2D62
MAETMTPLEGLLLPVADAPEWDALVREALSPNPFFSPAFLVPYAAHLGPAGLRLAVVREKVSGRWLAAAPVARRRCGFLLRERTLWAAEYGPLGVPLVHPEAGSEALALLLETAAKGTPLLRLPFLPVGGAVTQRLKTAAKGWRWLEGPVEERASHDGGAEGEAQLAAALTTKRRKEMERLKRRLSEDGELVFDSLSGADAQAAMAEFLALEQSGWKGRGATALASREATRRFAEGFAARLAAQDDLRLDRMRLDGRPLAMLAVIRAGGRAFAWKIAFDEGFARFSPGQHLALHAMRQTLADPALPLGAIRWPCPATP